MSKKKAPVTAIVVTKWPDMDHLGQTLHSLSRQDYPPSEVLVIDSTPGGVGAGEPESCGICGNKVREAVSSLESEGVEYTVVEDEELGIGEARQRGMDEASEPVAWHLDEDAVIQNRNWVAKALNRLSEDGVAAVGGSVTPINGSGVWKAAGALDAAADSVPGGWYLMHPIAYCDDSKCTRVGQHRGEDITLRSQLTDYGRLERIAGNVASKSLPTTRQSIVRDIVVSAASGAVVSLVSDYARRKVLGR